MQFKLVLNSRQWYIRVPLQSGKDGWSEWSEVDRQTVLYHLELGWTYDTE